MHVCVSVCVGVSACVLDLGQGITKWSYCQSQDCEPLAPLAFCGCLWSLLKMLRLCRVSLPG